MIVHDRFQRYPFTIVCRSFSTTRFLNHWTIVFIDPFLLSMNNYVFKYPFYDCFTVVSKLSLVTMVQRSLCTIVERSSPTIPFYDRWTVGLNEWCLAIGEQSFLPILFDDCSTIVYNSPYFLLRSIVEWSVVTNPFYDRWTIVFNLFIIVDTRPLPTIDEQ